MRGRGGERLAPFPRHRTAYCSGPASTVVRTANQSGALSVLPPPVTVRSPQYCPSGAVCAVFTVTERLPVAPAASVRLAGETVAVAPDPAAGARVIAAEAENVCAV